MSNTKLPEASVFVASQQPPWAVTDEWMRGWNAARQALADRERQAGEAVARVRTWTKNGEGHGELVDWLDGADALPDGEHDLFASLPAPQAVQAGWKLVPPPSLYDGDDPRSDDLADLYGDAMMAFNNAVPFGQRGFSEWCDRFEAALEVLAAAAPSPDGKAEQAEAPSARYKQISTCKECEHCAYETSGYYGCRLADRRFEQEGKSHQPPAWCTLPALATQPTASNAGERELLDQAHKQICHLINDLTLTIEDDGLTRYLPVGNLMYSNLVAALIELAPKMLAALATKPPAGEQKPFAWATFDGEGSYDLRLFEDNEDYRDQFIKRNGPQFTSWVLALYLAPPPEQVAQDREDAERYRTLRDDGGLPYAHVWHTQRESSLSGVDLDNHIDAYRAARARGEGGRNADQA